jgi:NitT/TauT family transport system permease protein
MHVMKQANHAHHHVMLRYPITMAERLYSIFWGPLLIVALMALATEFYPYLSPAHETISFQTLLLATLATCIRLAVAYVIAVIIAIPLCLFVTSSAAAEAIFLPVFDVLESVPILALFPVFIMVFIRFGALDAAAIAILALAMLWNLVFTVVGGIKIIPRDIVDAAHVFGLSGFSFLWRVLVPAVVPQFVTGSILALAQGWNIIIVAEVLHTYIPGGTSAQDLFGIGAILVQASATGQTQLFLWAVFLMVVVIAVFNFFVWQKLLHFAQRFRFD